MTRPLAALVLVAIGAGYAAADIPPPPPPKGQKYVGVDNSVALAKGVSGYTFILVEGHGRGAPHYTYTVLSLSDKPTPVPQAGRHGVCVLAIPEAEAKRYKTEEELSAAMEDGALKDVPRLWVGGEDLLPVSDKRDSVPWTYTITAINPKKGAKGMTVRTERDGKPVKDKERGDRSNPGDKDLTDDRLAADAGRATRGGVAGLFAAAALVGMGLWLVGRRRAV